MPAHHASKTINDRNEKRKYIEKNNVARNGINILLVLITDTQILPTDNL